MTTVKLEDGREFPVYEGSALSWSIGLYMTHAEAERGYPKARAVITAMKQHRPAELERERVDMLKGSFNRMFGHNMRKCLTLIENDA